MIVEWLSNNMEIIGLALLCSFVIVIVLISILFYKLTSLRKAHRSLMSGMKGKNLEQMLEAYLTRVQGAETRVKDLSELCEEIKHYAQKSLQNVALIRFNAFENMGSDLSFAAAFLDQNGDGMVLSSINSREESRVYAKPVVNRASSYHLSQEEVQAIKLAIQNGSK